MDDTSAHLDLDLAQVAARALNVDLDPKAWSGGRGDLAIAIAFEVVRRECERQRLRRRRELADAVVREARVGLQRGATARGAR